MSHRIRGSGLGPGAGAFGRWKITGSCVSVPAGPGFHRAAAELIQALGEKEIKDMEWKDSTNYLEDPDFEALRRETFEPWLAEQLKQALEELDRDPGGRSACSGTRTSTGRRRSQGRW